jgi:hypothetical protein
MAATAEILRTPLEAYLSTSYEPDAEFVNGAIEVRPMGEWNHANWQAAIPEFFRGHRRDWAMGIQTVLLLDPQGTHYQYRAGALEPLDAPAFDLPGSACRFDLAEIEKLLD